MEGVIYIATNTINDKSYIGKSVNFKKRKRDHLRSAKYKYDNFVFHKAIRKHGEENFEWNILYTGEELILNDKETEYIKIHNSNYISGCGYNMTFGGDGQTGHKHSQEFKDIMSIKMKGNKYSVGRTPMNKGMEMSDEQKEKLRVINTGKKLLKETKLKISLALKGRVFTEEHRNRLASVNRTNCNKTKYSFFNTELGSFTGTMLAFTEKYSLDRSTITKLANGKIKSSLGWRLLTAQTNNR